MATSAVEVDLDTVARLRVTGEVLQPIVQQAARLQQSLY
jgi:hypothetical protein